jgi:ATP-binding cassette subfamily B protein
MALNTNRRSAFGERWPAAGLRGCHRIPGSALAKTCTFLLLGYFADSVLQKRIYVAGTLSGTLIFIGLAFIGLAAVEGSFAFLSGRLAAYTAEGITRRVRDFLFDHIQRLSFSYQPPRNLSAVTSDVDSPPVLLGTGHRYEQIVLLFTVNWAVLSIIPVGCASVGYSGRAPCFLWFFKEGNGSL